MVICLKSHQHQKLISTYGAIDIDRDLTDAVLALTHRKWWRIWGLLWLRLIFSLVFVNIAGFVAISIKLQDIDMF